MKLIIIKQKNLRTKHFTTKISFFYNADEMYTYVCYFKKLPKCYTGKTNNIFLKYNLRI